MGYEIPTKRIKRPGLQVGADVGHHLQIKMGVVDAHQPEAEDIVYVEEMPDISAREVCGRQSSRILLQWDGRSAFTAPP